MENQTAPKPVDHSIITEIEYEFDFLFTRARNLLRHLSESSKDEFFERLTAHKEKVVSTLKDAAQPLAVSTTPAQAVAPVTSDKAPETKPEESAQS